MRSRSSSLISGGDHERSTVYQVREAARLDLYQSQQEHHHRSTLRRGYAREGDRSREQSAECGEEQSGAHTSASPVCIVKLVSSATTAASVPLCAVSAVAAASAAARSAWYCDSLHCIALQGAGGSVRSRCQQLLHPGRGQGIAKLHAELHTLKPKR